jgi:hypothetical protein
MATSLHLSLAAATPASLRSSSSAAFLGKAVCASAAPRLARQHRNGSLVVEAKIREIFMPALSSTMTEGKIVSWVKNEGDKLSKGIVGFMGFGGIGGIGLIRVGLVCRVW